jgi:hypothetical protein
MAASAATGGAVGAVGMALLSWSQIARSLSEIEEVLERSTSSRKAIRMALSRFIDDVGAFRAAFDRLKEILRIQSSPP